MIPSLAEVRRAYAFHARRFDLPRRFDEPAIAAALRDAADLAAGRREDEPAALLFTLTRLPRQLGEMWESLPLVLAENHARNALGLHLRLSPEDVDLENLRLRVAARTASFEDLRTFVAARLQPPS
jgi:hypothetical protein